MITWISKSPCLVWRRPSWPWQILAYKQVLKNQILVLGLYCILHFFVGWMQRAIFFVFVFYFSSDGWFTCWLHIAAKAQTGYVESSCSLVGWWSVHSIKTTFLKREMLLEFMSCVSVTFISKKTYEKNSVSEITQCRQSLCHVCLQCIKGKHRAKMQYCINCVLKKDIRNKPLKAPISNHIYFKLNKTSLFLWLMDGVAAFEHDFNFTVGLLQCCEENMRIGQEMRGDRGDGHA